MRLVPRLGLGERKQNVALLTRTARGKVAVHRRLGAFVDKVAPPPADVSRGRGGLIGHAIMMTAGRGDPQFGGPKVLPAARATSSPGYQPSVPEPPLNGPTMLAVIQPP